MSACDCMWLQVGQATRPLADPVVSKPRGLYPGPSSSYLRMVQHVTHCVAGSLDRGDWPDRGAKQAELLGQCQNAKVLSQRVYRHERLVMCSSAIRQCTAKVCGVLSHCCN